MEDSNSDGHRPPERNLAVAVMPDPVPGVHQRAAEYCWPERNGVPHRSSGDLVWVGTRLDAKLSRQHSLFLVQVTFVEADLHARESGEQVAAPRGQLG
jgi:hypothetical protein